MSARTKRVIPYVEDKRNCLIFEPQITLNIEEMASLQAAMKRAIETIFQLESNELAAEPMPDRDSRQSLLLYEAAEGGAGVLRRLVDDPAAFPLIMQEALRICHYDPDSGEDLRRAPNTEEDCEAACYDCLLSYGNQREHALLDRRTILPTLKMFAAANVQSSPADSSRESHFDQLYGLCESDLEKEWLKTVQAQNLRLPDAAQKQIEVCQTRPDFFYNSNGIQAAIYIDGSHHDYPHRQARDQQQTDCLDDYGISVIRFGYKDDWKTIFEQNKHIFGEAK